MRALVVKIVSALSVAALLVSCQVKMPEDVLPPESSIISLIFYFVLFAEDLKHKPH